MKSVAIKKRSIVVVGHRTSISLEDEFWESLRDIAEKRHQQPGQLIAEIDKSRHFVNLSSAIRLFVLRYHRDQAERQSGKAPPLAQEHLNSIEHGPSD